MVVIPLTLIIFAGVGVISTIIDIGTLNIGRRFGMPVWAATALGFVLGATNGYFLNSLWSFREVYTVGRYEKYFIVSLGGLLLTELIMEILHVKTKWMTLNQAKLVAVFIVFFWNYSLNLLWTFA